jgi:hypothetical protein
MERVYEHLSKNGCRKSGFLADPDLTGTVFMLFHLKRRSLCVNAPPISDVSFLMFVYTHTSNFSAIWRLSSLPVTGLQI